MELHIPSRRRNVWALTASRRGCGLWRRHVGLNPPMPADLHLLGAVPRHRYRTGIGTAASTTIHYLGAKGNMIGLVDFRLSKRYKFSADLARHACIILAILAVLAAILRSFCGVVSWFGDSGGAGTAMQGHGVALLLQLPALCLLPPGTPSQIQARWVHFHGTGVLQEGLVRFLVG